MATRPRGGSARRVRRSARCRLLARELGSLPGAGRRARGGMPGGQRLVTLGGSWAAVLTVCAGWGVRVRLPASKPPGELSGLSNEPRSRLRERRSRCFPPDAWRPVLPALERDAVVRQRCRWEAGLWSVSGLQRGAGCPSSGALARIGHPGGSNTQPDLPKNTAQDPTHAPPPTPPERHLRTEKPAPVAPLAASAQRSHAGEGLPQPSTVLPAGFERTRDPAPGESRRGR